MYISLLDSSLLGIENPLLQQDVKKTNIFLFFLFKAGISHMRMPIAYWYWDVEDGEPFPAPNMDDTDMQR